MRQWLRATKKTCAWLAPSSAVVAALADQSAKLAATNPTIDIVSKVTPPVAIAMCVAGGVGYVALVCHERIKDRFENFVSFNFVSTRAKTEEEIRWICDYATKNFQDRVSSLAQAREWHSKNRNILHLVHREAKGGALSERAGYICILPLNKIATEKMWTGQMVAKDLTKNHITKGFSSCHSIYIGAVAADGFRARAHALASLKSLLQNEENARGKPIFSRAATEAGLRLLEKNNFAPVRPDLPAGIGALYVSKPSQ